MYSLELEWSMFCIVIVERHRFFDEALKLPLGEEPWLYVSKQTVEFLLQRGRSLLQQANSEIRTDTNIGCM